MTKQSIKPALLILFIFFTYITYSQSKFNPSVEAGIAYRPGVIELSDFSKYPNPSPKGYTYTYSSTKHFNNVNLSLALQQYVLKQRVSLQAASYFRYGHLYYGKNAQGVSSNKEKEYKQLKYDLFIDGIYHFKKGKSGIGIVIGAGIGNMNYGTLFIDSAYRGNDTILAKRGFRFMAPRIIIGVNKNNFSFSAIAYGTPDSEYDGNPSIWLEFKAAYAFSLFRKKKINN
jgi:hypothetical protein